MVYTQPSLPLFWGHGAADEEVPIEFAQEAIGFLYRTLVVPHNLEFRVYDDMGHSINDDEIEDLLLWLVEVLK
jgi:predicted esterase